MNGTLHQNVQGELSRQNRDDLQVKTTYAHPQQAKLKSEKLYTIRYVSRLLRKVKGAIVTAVIALTVLLIAQNVAMVFLDGGRGITDNLVM